MIWYDVSSILVLAPFDVSPQVCHHNAFSKATLKAQRLGQL